MLKIGNMTKSEYVNAMYRCASLDEAEALLDRMDENLIKAGFESSKDFAVRMMAESVRIAD
jgi:hypothetical protein